KADGALPAITHDLFLRIQHDPSLVPSAVITEVERQAEEFQFFHWHLAFPDVFRLPGPDASAENESAGWSGGFDVILGNPPWERVKIQEKEFFSGPRPDIAQAPNATVRRRMIERLAEEDPALCREYIEALRQAEGESHIIRASGRYPLCGRGD